MKKTILALAISSVSFGGMAEDTLPRDSFESWAEFQDYVQNPENKVSNINKQAMVQAWLDTTAVDVDEDGVIDGGVFEGASSVEFVTKGDGEVYLQVKGPDGYQTDISLTDLYGEDGGSRGDNGQLNMLKKMIEKNGRELHETPMTRDELITGIKNRDGERGQLGNGETTPELKELRKAAVHVLNEAAKRGENGAVFSISELGELMVSVNGGEARKVESDEILKAKELVKQEAQKREQGIDPIDPIDDEQPIYINPIDPVGGAKEEQKLVEEHTDSIKSITDGSFNSVDAEKEQAFNTAAQKLLAQGQTDKQISLAGNTLTVDGVEYTIADNGDVTLKDGGSTSEVANIKDILTAKGVEAGEEHAKNVEQRQGEIKDGYAKKIEDAIKNGDEEAKDELRAEIKQAVSGQEAQRYATVAEIYNASQDAKIAKNEQDIATLFGEVDRLDEKMDGVMAGVHAVNNARPYLSSEGDTAIGAGVGYAGDAGAVAFGAAHAFTDSLSASMTLNVTTGSYSEVSGGAGVQYKF